MFRARLGPARAIVSPKATHRPPRPALGQPAREPRRRAQNRCVCSFLFTAARCRCSTCCRFSRRRQPTSRAPCTRPRAHQNHQTTLVSSTGRHQKCERESRPLPLPPTACRLPPADLLMPPPSSAACTTRCASTCGRLARPRGSSSSASRPSRTSSTRARSACSCPRSPTRRATHDLFTISCIHAVNPSRHDRIPTSC